MFYEETKQNLSYISVCSLSVLYNSKFILTVTPLGTNAVVVTRGHCFGHEEKLAIKQIYIYRFMQ